MEKYLREHYEDEITNLMNLPEDREHLSIHVDLCRLQQRDFDLFEAILYDAQTECTKWDGALLAVQKFIAEEKDAFLEPDYQIKVNCHVRFVHMPESDSRYKQSFPGKDQIDQFVEVKGNVVRMSQAKLLELKQEFECGRCSDTKVVEADYIRMYAIDPLKKCTAADCTGAMRPKFDQPVPKYCIDYQEIRIQEPTGVSNMPKSLLVTLENDLVATCQPGDCVTVCGTIERRWRSYQKDKPCVLTIALRAISLTHEQKRINVDAKQMIEQMVLMQMEWNEAINEMGEMRVRDMIVKSICSEVYGMYPVKLAMALAVCSGGIENTTTASPYGLSHRGQSHLLLVGDPGLAKSRLLLSAAAFAPRAIHTTGMGCSSAGLTAAAVKEDGEWQLEAGALVLADGGICCIDEFNLMRPTDRASIHEAMEQQTISMAKAGIVCKLSTRCAILAAANPKNLYTMNEPGGTSTLNIGIDSPLLSRFDLVYILRDERNPQWDSRIADHLLDLSSHRPRPKQRDEQLWSIEKLQAHFVAIRNIHPKMSDEANAMLGAYYRRCRNDKERDLGRTTIRLLDSLTRLAQAHARLLFRDRVNASDAAIVIRLMESTYGFGRILQPFNVIMEELPLGPSTPDISELYRVLKLGEYRVSVDPKVEQNEETMNNEQSAPLDESARIELDEILNFNFENEAENTNDRNAIDSQTLNVETVPRTVSNESENLVAVEDMDVDDVVLSQALDQVERIISDSQTFQPHTESVQQVQLQQRPKLSLFAIPKKKSMILIRSQQPETSLRSLNVASATESNQIKLTLPKPALVRNRLLLTQSDDSDDDEPINSGKRQIFDECADSRKKKVATQTIERLNCFQNPNVIVINSNNESSTSAHETDDSAYETINSNEISITTNISQAVVVTSPIATSGSVSKILEPDDGSDEDYSCLDFDF